MVTRTTPGIDWDTFPESDGEPMAENESNRVQMTDLIYSLQLYTADWERVHVGGNQIIYYNQHHGHDHISPDVYVAVDVDRGVREIYQTWVEGKFPDVVFEIGSESTVGVDLGHKRMPYARLGAREYYIYDPTGYLQPPLRAYYLVGTTLEPGQPLADGGYWSGVLGAQLRQVGRWLRVIDPATGEPVPTPEETRLAAIEAMAQARAERIAREAAESALQAERSAREAAQEQAGQLRAALAEALAKIHGTSDRPADHIGEQ